MTIFHQQRYIHWMNSGSILSISIHTAVLMLIQILLLLNFAIPLGSHFSLTIYIYPLIIILLPLSISRIAVLTIAFVLGLMVDYFYQSPGVHASALVLMAYLRPYILALIEPRGGYRADSTPNSSNYGLGWFLSYCAIMLLIHLLTYFSIDAFSLIFIVKILVNTIISFIASYLIIFLYQLIVRL